MTTWICQKCNKPVRLPSRDERKRGVCSSCEVASWLPEKRAAMGKMIGAAMRGDRTAAEQEADRIMEMNRMNESAEAGIPWSEVAKSAYRAYAASTGNKNFRGEPMPEFDSLPQSIRTAWEAAVRQAGSCLRLTLGVTPPDESRWTGWIPPGINEGK